MLEEEIARMFYILDPNFCITLAIKGVIESIKSTSVLKECLFYRPGHDEKQSQPETNLSSERKHRRMPLRILPGVLTVLPTQCLNICCILKLKDCGLNDNR